MKGGTNEEMAKGKVRIDVNDLVGKSIGQLEVKSYGGQWYENTAGGKSSGTDILYIAHAA